jgi:bacterioferritin-associated ferredoxin
MIVCSCTAISDRDIEGALVEILNQPDAPIPTPGVVYRHLQKRMNCCGCAPLAVETIYNKVQELETKGLISPNVCAATRSKLLEFSVWRTRLRGEKVEGIASEADAEGSARDVA